MYLSDDAASVKELFKLAPIAFGGGGKPGWYDVLRSELAALLGEDNFSLTYAWREDKFMLTLALPLDITDEQLGQVRVLLGSVPPRNQVVEIDELPLGFSSVSYLENSGTQYMDTGLIPSNVTGIKVDSQFVRINDSIACGCRTSSPAYTRFYAVRPPYLTSNGKYVNGYGWGAWVEFNPVGGSYREETKLNWQNSRIAECRAGVIQLNALTFEPTLPMFVFAANIAGKPSNMFIGRIWSLSVSEYENVIANFIPCIDAGGLPCLYNTVNRKVLRNLGAGGFVAGVDTLTQLEAVLSGLPDRTGQDGGELHLRLADALYESAVASGIIEATATAKNWQIAYDPTTEIAA